MSQRPWAWCWSRCFDSSEMGKQPQTMALHSLADQITSHELKVKQRHSVSADVHETLEMCSGQCSSSPCGGKIVLALAARWHEVTASQITCAGRWKSENRRRHYFCDYSPTQTIARTDWSRKGTPGRCWLCRFNLRHNQRARQATASETVSETMSGALARSNTYWNRTMMSASEYDLWVQSPCVIS